MNIRKFYDIDLLGPMSSSDNTIPTAEEFLKNSRNINYSTLNWPDTQLNILPFIEADLIEFAKLHCKAQLEAILKNAEVAPLLKEFIQDSWGNGDIIDKDSIRNAYKIDQIK